MTMMLHSILGTKKPPIDRFRIGVSKKEGKNPLTAIHMMKHTNPIPKQKCMRK